MPSKKILTYINSSIQEICEDIALWGYNSPAYLYLSKDGKIIDYLPAAASAEEKILYIDEECIETTLFNVLWNYIASMCMTAGKPYTNAGIWCTSARLALNMTMEDLANELNVSVESISMWERGLRNPKIDKLIKFAYKHNLQTEPLFK